jgi:hypothetical protein
MLQFPGGAPREWLLGQETHCFGKRYQINVKTRGQFNETNNQTNMRALAD